MANPKKTEDEWFVRNEAEMIKSFKRERERRQKELDEMLKQAEARKKKELHWMKCPKCGSDLQAVTIEDIKIDKCPLCEGVFLDRGELEELMLKKQGESRGFLKRVLGILHQ